MLKPPLLWICCGRVADLLYAFGLLYNELYNKSSISRSNGVRAKTSYGTVDNKYQLSQMDPRDAPSRERRAVHRGEPLGQGRPSTVASIVNLVPAHSRTT